KANQAVDHLDSIGDRFPLGRHSILVSDPTLGYFLLYDSLKLTEPRCILNNRVCAGFHQKHKSNPMGLQVATYPLIH
ncbi:hypothetical protein LINGRAHAP2_LOCUS12880, partial [Linum grandiflorum]